MNPCPAPLLPWPPSPLLHLGSLLVLVLLRAGLLVAARGGEAAGLLGFVLIGRVLVTLFDVVPVCLNLLGLGHGGERADLPVIVAVLLVAQLQPADGHLGPCPLVDPL